MRRYREHDGSRISSHDVPVGRVGHHLVGERGRDRGERRDVLGARPEERLDHRVDRAHAGLGGGDRVGDLGVDRVDRRRRDESVDEDRAVGAERRRRWRASSRGVGEAGDRRHGATPAPRGSTTFGDVLQVRPRDLRRDAAAERHQHEHAAVAHDLDRLVGAVDLVGRRRGPQLLDRLRVRDARGGLVARVPVAVHLHVVEDVLADLVPRLVDVVGDEHRGGRVVRGQLGHARLVAVLAARRFVGLQHARRGRSGRRSRGRSGRRAWPPRSSRRPT